MRDDNAITKFWAQYRFLSNFYPVYAGIPFGYARPQLRYPTVEHAYQAAKTLDLEWRFRIKNAERPGGAKALGNKCPLRSDWENVRINIMRDLLRSKFAQLSFKTKLLDTGERQLIEGNKWGDQFWGMTWETEYDEGKSVGKTLVGENHLGILLMQVRDELRG